MNSTVSLPLVALLDEELSSGRFGDEKFLSTHLIKLYRGIGKILESWIGEQVPKLEENTPTEVKIVVRRALDECFSKLEKQQAEVLPEIKEDIALIKKWIDTVSSYPEHPKINDLLVLDQWDANPFLMSISQQFVYSMADEGVKVATVEPSDEQLAIIGEARKLLSSLIPNLTSSTVPLANAVSLIEGGISSGYINENPYTYMINVTQLADPLMAADAILHEALHQKLADIRLTSNLLEESYHDLESEARADIPLPWPKVESPRPFSVARGIATCHVYVHISFLYLAALEHFEEDEGLQNLGREEIEKRLIRSYERARYLSEILNTERSTSNLGSDGKDLMGWMGQIVDQLGSYKFSGKGQLSQQGNRWNVPAN